jgi:hypothetical protein
VAWYLTVGLACGKDYVGFIPNSDWCNCNCRRGKWHYGTSIRTREGVFPAFQVRTDTKKTHCGIELGFPDYPSTTKSDEAFGTGENAKSAGTIADIANNAWFDLEDLNPTGVCNRKLRGTNTRQPGKEYATEHIYEKHVVTMYLDWPSFNFTDEKGGFDARKLATCPTMEAVFDQTSTTPNSPCNPVMPAQALADRVTLFDSGCPKADRADGLYILESSINGLREGTLVDIDKKADFKALTCNKDWFENRAKLAALSAVF